MKISTLVLAAGVALLFAAPAHSQAELVTSQLADVDSVLTKEQGHSIAAEAVRGALAASTDREFRVQLSGGTQYMIVGMCDGGCSDLDLVLTDATGRKIAEDTALDDLPVMRVTGLDGTFTVTVKMVTCIAAECHYGVRIYQAVEQ